MHTPAWKRSAVIVVALLILVASAAILASCKRDDTGSKTPATEPTSTAGGEATGTGAPTGSVDASLPPTSQLPEMREGLVFTYVQQGGIALVKKQFGRPSATFRVPAADGTGGSVEFKDQRAYRFEWGYPAGGGTPVVIAHTVEAVSGQQRTPQDKGFADAITDGKTTVDEANRIIAKYAGASVTAAKVDPKGLMVPGYAWYMKDGSGFIVLDLTSLTPAQMESIGMADQGPYQALYWDATHWYRFES